MAAVSPPSLVKAARKLACVMVGDGIGNIVQQTPLIQAVGRWFKAVDVFMARSDGACRELFENIGIPTLRRVACQGELHLLTDRYDALFATWPMRGHRRRIRAIAAYQSPCPLKMGVTESQAACLGLLQAGWAGATPFPICGWMPVREELPPKPLVGISTGSNLHTRWQTKRYPGEHYLKAIDLMLAAKPELNFVHLGAPTDTPLPHPRVYDLRGKLTLGEAAGAIRKCQAFVGNDTGLVHIAAAHGVKAAVIFGPTVIRKNIPPRNAVAVSLNLFCQPCQMREWFKRPGVPGRCRIECLADLPPQTVATAVLELLHG